MQFIVKIILTILILLTIILTSKKTLAQLNTITPNGRPLHPSYVISKIDIGDISERNKSIKIKDSSASLEYVDVDSSNFMPLASAISPAVSDNSFADSKIFLPVNGKIVVTSFYGERFHPILQKTILHTGVDLRCNYDIVKSIASGRIIKETTGEREGNYIVIQHQNGIQSIYCHLSHFFYKKGDSVVAGAIIAISGATGEVTGPHLHFALKMDGKFINPLPFLLAVESIK